jgi:hypothetical protein
VGFHPSYTFVVDWCHMPILISLDQVIKGKGSDNLTKVVMGVLKKHGVFLCRCYWKIDLFWS